jgi:hypothetical protein
MAQRYALWLGDNRYSLVPFRSASDWAVIQTQLILWKKKERAEA